MLSSSMWPNFPTSRQNSSENFSLDAMSAWQPINQATEKFITEDFNNVWSAKSESNEESEKDKFFQSIWSASSINSAETNSVSSDEPKLIEETPTNSPSLKRNEIINCNDRWGSVIINQVTPWQIVEKNEPERRQHDPMVWRAKVDGTEVWEDYYLKQHGRRRPQADSSFSSDSVWSLASDLSQSTNSIWNSNNSDISIPSSDSYSQNSFHDINNRGNFNTTNGVRPSMTRNQAQKYLIDMGYSLSDAIGALVNNQMDLPKAINELQSKYRMSTNGLTTHNGMSTPTMSFNNRFGDNTAMARLQSVPSPINHLLSQNNSNLTPMMGGGNYSGSYDMFQSEMNDQQQMMESPYFGMDPTMSQYTKRQCSMPLARDNSYRNMFPSNNGSSGGGRALSGNGGNQYNTDIGALAQGMGRMNMNFSPGHASMNQNGSFLNKWPSNTNGYNPMHNSYNNNNTALNSNSTNANNIDLRQNFPSSSVPNPFTRSISKQQPPLYPRNSGMGWHADTTQSNGAFNDSNQARLAKNMSCSGLLDNNVGIIIKKVVPQSIDIIKAICFESGSMTNFQIQPHIQSIIAHFNSATEARRCMNVLQSQINARVELLSDDYMH